MASSKEAGCVGHAWPRAPPTTHRAAAVAVTLRQLGHIDGPSPSLAAARARHGTAAELLDPDGDRNGG
ncbi:MAG TPA: hypothetical protein VGM60_11760 [Pseudonocardia sp.]|jgi:hypothetical protein|uniref:hypothetical protein n=1 Tax=Pseudonocardia sp. TaxID=60912 RepID=UPI002F401BE4